MANNSELELGFDLQEALNRENINKSDLQMLREPEIPLCPKSITDQQLTLFFNACSKNVEYTRKAIQRYYEHRKKGPEFFSNRNPESPEVQQCFEHQANFYLPLTPEGYSVIFHQLTSPKSSDYIFDEACKTSIMTMDLCFHMNGPRPGVVFVFDMKNVSLSHLLRPKISSIKKYITYVQDGLPAKLKAIHVLNTVGFFDKVLFLIKPFTNAKILNMLHLHPASLDMEKFYKECIPKSCLPKDYGGDLGTIEELNRENCKEMLRLKNYFMAEEKQRPSEQTEIETKFKKLNID